MDKKYCVYVHTNKANGKKYVGITRRNVRERWRKGSAYKCNPHFYRSIQKYGWDGFEHEILMTGLTKQQADEAEKYYIELWNCADNNNGYNIALGGDGHESYSDVTKKKMSESAKRRNADSEKFNRICEGNRRRWLDKSEHEKASNSLKKYYERNPSRRSEIGAERKRYFLEHPEKKKTRRVNQYSLDGVFVQTWNSIAEAGSKLGVSTQNICTVCAGRRKNAGGYVWRYSDAV